MLRNERCFHIVEQHRRRCCQQEPRRACPPAPAAPFASWLPPVSSRPVAACGIETRDDVLPVSNQCLVLVRTEAGRIERPPSARPAALRQPLRRAPDVRRAGRRRCASTDLAPARARLAAFQSSSCSRWLASVGRSPSSMPARAYSVRTWVSASAIRSRSACRVVSQALVARRASLAASNPLAEAVESAVEAVDVDRATRVSQFRIILCPPCCQKLVNPSSAVDDLLFDLQQTRALLCVSHLRLVPLGAATDEQFELDSRQFGVEADLARQSGLL